MSKKVVLAHSGRQHSYHVARNLQLLGCLKSYYTSSYVASERAQRLITKFNINFFSRRFLPGLSGKEIHSNWMLELPEVAARSLNRKAAKVSQLVFSRDRKFDIHVANKLKSQEFDMFWGFQGSCCRSLHTANLLNKKSLVEMTMAYVPFAKSIMSEEVKLHPEWSDSIDIASYPGWYEERLVKEPQIAKTVISASSFLRRTLTINGIPENKIKVLPLGFDIAEVEFSEKSDRVSGSPLKLLFVGRITQGKGIKYMLDAIEKFSSRDVELHIVGNIIGSGKEFKRRKDLYTYYGSKNQKELFSFYHRFDAFLFPSLMEGFPLAVIEAMGAGLPVITTPNTSAEELIVESKTGYIVPIRDVQAIVQSIEHLLALSEDELIQMRRAARNVALEFTWDKHRERLQYILETI